MLRGSYIGMKQVAGALAHRIAAESGIHIPLAGPPWQVDNAAVASRAAQIARNRSQPCFDKSCFAAAACTTLLGSRHHCIIGPSFTADGQKGRKPSSIRYQLHQRQLQQQQWFAMSSNDGYHQLELVMLWLNNKAKWGKSP